MIIAEGSLRKLKQHTVLNSPMNAEPPTANTICFRQVASRRKGRPTNKRIYLLKNRLLFFTFLLSPACLYQSKIKTKQKQNYHFIAHDSAIKRYIFFAIRMKSFRNSCLLIVKSCCLLYKKNVITVDDMDV